MKICYVAVDVALPHYRGASTHVYELAKHFTLLGHEVDVIARKSTSNEDSYALLGKIEVHRLQRGILFSSSKSSFASAESKGSYRGKTPLIVWKLYELYLRTVFAFYSGIVTALLVRKKGHDVILERESLFGAGAIASVLTGRPLVLEVIGNRVTKFQLSRAKKIIAYSREMFKGLVDDSKIEIVSAGVDTELSVLTMMREIKRERNMASKTRE